MIFYLISFILCSGLLLLIYRLFLATENMYRFNRFYLLFSLVFSLVIPFVTIQVPAINIPGFNNLVINKTITTIADKDAQPVKQLTNTQTILPLIKASATPQVTAQNIPIVRHKLTGKTNPLVTPQILTETTPAVISTVENPQIIHQPARNYLADVLMLLYGLASLVMLLRFARNSWQIGRLVIKNPIVSYQDTKLVLINDEVTPHSFLKYVFINKDEYNNGTIEPEIICHEQTHVRQLHSVDIIIIELLQVVCWFNPFIYIYRKAIQLNHEFLADEAVIESYPYAPAYQYLLLAKASQTGGLHLSSQFNYQVTKKRIIMMTKNTSTLIALYKKLAIVPLLVCALLLFSHKIIAKNEPISKIIKAIIKPDTARTLPEQYADILAQYKQTDPNARTPYLKFSAADKKRLEILFRQMNTEQQKRQWLRFVPPSWPMAKSLPSQQQLDTWSNSHKYGVWINNKRIKNSELANYKASDFDKYNVSHLTPVAVKNDGFSYQVDLTTTAYYANYKMKALADTSWHIVHNGRIPDEKTIEYGK